ncbi:pyridoxal-phosphate dependent enzyme [archaeon]|nr:MAG: pyridoxal-phosphate dependent enzyme [archaeon]
MSSSDKAQLPVHGEYCISAADVVAAAARVARYVHRTPLMTSSFMNSAASEGCAPDAPPRSAYFKCECFQKSGSFKARGACNAVLSLSPEEAARGVCTHSSGNHAQALAVAAAMRGIDAHIVMPANAPAVKVSAVRGYGGKVITCESTQAAREAAAAKVVADTGARFVHPSEDPLVIAGQGTMALEILSQAAELRHLPAPVVHVGASSPAPPSDGAVPVQPAPVDAIIVPVGGGGMISGIATLVRAVDRRIRIIAAEPAAADDAARSKAAGSIQAHAKAPDTVADGLRTTLGTLRSRAAMMLLAGGRAKGVRSTLCGIRRRRMCSVPTEHRHDARAASRLLHTSVLTRSHVPLCLAGTNTWPIVRDVVDEVITVSEEDIIRAMRLVYERMKLVIEPSAAVSVAVLLSPQFKALPGIEHVAVVLCGGNVDLDALPFVTPASMAGM